MAAQERSHGGIEACVETTRDFSQKKKPEGAVKATAYSDYGYIVRKIMRSRIS